MDVARLEQLLATILRDGLWVPIDRYIELYGETREAVHTRRSRGYWIDEVHSRFVEGSGLWINLLAVNEWAASGGSRRASRSATTPPARRSGSA